MTVGSYKDFIDKRNQALITLDVNWAKTLSCNRGLSDETILAGLHKARYECVHIPDELRIESGRWLKQKGLKRLTGESIEVPENLPEPLNNIKF